MEQDHITTLYYPRMLEKAKYERIPGYTQEEVIDELYITLSDALPQFKGLNGATQKTFAETVMRRKVIDLQRIGRTKKRKNGIGFADLGWSEYGERIYEEDEEN